MIQYITITSADEVRTPPDKPVLRLSMGPQTAKLEILEDIYDDEPLAAIDMRHVDLSNALQFLMDQARREAAAAAAIDRGEIMEHAGSIPAPLVGPQGESHGGS